MKIAHIGATGFIGSRVLDEELRRGHEVTAIVRDPSRLRSRARLHVARADVQDPDQVAAAVSGHDVVVSTFHPGGHDANLNPALYRDIVEGTWSIIRGVQMAGNIRLLYVGGTGSLHTRPGVMLVDDPGALAKGMIGGRPYGTYPAPACGAHAMDIPKAARIAFLLFENSLDLDWTFLSPSRFIGEFGGRSSAVRVGGEDLLMEDDGSPARIDVEDLAFALVNELEEPKHRAAHFTVASGGPAALGEAVTARD